MKRLTLVLAAAISVSPAFAEYLTTPVYEGYHSNETVLQLQGTRARYHEFSPTVSVGKVEIFVPESVDGSRRNDVLDLWNKLRAVCPECSTAGTFGGSTVVGGNILCPENPAKPLFGLTEDAFAETVTIPKAEYDRLVARDRVLKNLEVHAQ